jgi:hypothetical protein
MPKIGFKSSKTDPIIIPNEKFIWWAAGFYEGEGFVINYSKTKLFFVSIKQKNLWPLELIKERFGGSIYFVKTKKLDQSDNYINIWKLSSSRAVNFLASIFNLLSPKRQEQIIRKLEESTEYTNFHYDLFKKLMTEIYHEPLIQNESRHKDILVTAGE